MNVIRSIVYIWVKCRPENFDCWWLCSLGLWVINLTGTGFDNLSRISHCQNQMDLCIDLIGQWSHIKVNEAAKSLEARFWPIITTTRFLIKGIVVLNLRSTCTLLGDLISLQTSLWQVSLGSSYLLLILRIKKSIHSDFFAVCTLQFFITYDDTSHDQSKRWQNYIRIVTF